MSADIDLRFGGFFLLGLLSLTLLMAGIGLWWLQRQRMLLSDRLPTLHALQTVRATRPDTVHRWLRASPQVQQWLLQLPGTERYDRFLLQTGWPLRSTEVLLGTAALALLVLLLCGLANVPVALAVTAALAAALMVQGVLLWRRNHRAAQMERQLPDALALVARSMQAGHAFSSALQIAAQESPQPMGTELRKVFNEIQYGESANDALTHWTERVVGQDVRIFVIAVRIQSETGGNLAELLNQTAALIRERQKMRGAVRVLSAEGRISAVILTLLPFALAAALSVLTPDFMSQLWTDPLGIRMLTLALGLMGIGMLWMWHLARIQP